MSKSLIVLVTLLALLTSCKSSKSSSSEWSFDYIQSGEVFEIKLIEFYKNTAFCGTEGLPYALLIGETNSELLPAKISVLSHCDDRIFPIGQVLEINPTTNPTRETTMNPIYFVKDSVINGKKSRWLIGSENKAIWETPKMAE